MIEQEIKQIFYSLQDAQKKAVHREAKIIRETGAENFWVETGSQVDDPDVYWVLRGFAMMELGIISSDQFYGLN